MISDSHDLLGRLEETESSEHHRHVVEYIAAQTMKVLDVDPAPALLGSNTLSEIGLDSVTFMELHHELMSTLTIDLPIEQLAADASLDELAGLVLKQLALAGVVGEPPPGRYEDGDQTTL